MCHLGSQLTHIYHHQRVTGKTVPVLTNYAVKKNWVEGKLHYSLTQVSIRHSENICGYRLFNNSVMEKER